MTSDPLQLVPQDFVRPGDHFGDMSNTNGAPVDWAWAHSVGTIKVAETIPTCIEQYRKPLGQGIPTLNYLTSDDFGSSDSILSIILCLSASNRRYSDCGRLLFLHDPPL